MNKELFSVFVGKGVKIGRGGHESKEGLLLGAYGTHIALFTEAEGVIYYPYSHLKSLTSFAKGKVNYDDMYKTIEILPNESFVDLLNSQIRQWVKINRGGPDKVEGILLDANNEYVEVSFNDELVYIATYHIKSVSFGEKFEVYERSNSTSQTLRRRK